jgi:hypothetical protein
MQPVTAGREVQSVPQARSQDGPSLRPKPRRSITAKDEAFESRAKATTVSECGGLSQQ